MPALAPAPRQPPGGAPWTRHVVDASSRGADGEKARRRERRRPVGHRHGLGGGRPHPGLPPPRPRGGARLGPPSRWAPRPTRTPFWWLPDGDGLDVIASCREGAGALAHWGPDSRPAAGPGRVAQASIPALERPRAMDVARTWTGNATLALGPRGRAGGRPLRTDGAGSITGRGRSSKAGWIMSLKVGYGRRRAGGHPSTGEGSARALAAQSRRGPRRVESIGIGTDGGDVPSLAIRRDGLKDILVATKPGRPLLAPLDASSSRWETAIIPPEGGARQAVGRPRRRRAHGLVVTCEQAHGDKHGVLACAAPRTPGKPCHWRPGRVVDLIDCWTSPAAAPRHPHCEEAEKSGPGRDWQNSPPPVVRSRALAPRSMSFHRR